jgi:Na+/H+ antiporter NhaD/arsenite permease-like protein
MAIVELIDSHNGFELITRKIRTRSKPKLVLIITAVTFLLSALLDNLTTAILMVSVCSKLLTEKGERLWFAAVIVIAANAGGAWSALGDVTTTMLWIGGQITALKVASHLVLPSLAVCIVPAAIIAYRFRGQVVMPAPVSPCTATELRDGTVMLFIGTGLLLFVPVFKTVTHLPPFMGILLALGIMWVVTTFLHRDKDAEEAERYAVARALQKVDTPSILFFLGILLAISALQVSGVLQQLASSLTAWLQNSYLIGVALGLLSAVVDNVPLVAAAQGMFSLSTYPPDDPFWQFLALTTGCGGSILIIGSAAGVAAMGMEEIKFGWYLKNVGWLAMIGLAAGIFIFLFEQFI